MNAPPALPRGWSRGTWCTVIVAVLAGQILLVFLLSAKPRLPAPPAAMPSALQLVTPSQATHDSLAEPHVSDPAESALVTARGYSGPVWVRRPPLDPASSEWIEPPRWLTQTQSGVTASSAQPARPSIVAQPMLATWPAAALPPTLPAAAPVVTNSVLRFEGALQRRRLLSTPELPAWEFNDVLLPTAVQLVVDETGAVQNATPLSRSGLEAADQRALKVAWGLRFAAAGDPNLTRLTWGTVVFQWHATAPAVAAAPATTP